MGVGAQPTGTVTFLFTDIADHTRLWEEFPSEMPGCLERHDEIVRGAIDRHGGYVFSTGGDAFCATFAHADAAITAAIEAQQALRSERWPVGCELRVRMGLHTGEAQERGGDYFGPSVIRTARLMSLGHGGQVLVSASSAQLLGQRAHLASMLLTLGEVALRGLGRTELVSELRYPGLDEEFPALRARTTRERKLPAVVDELVGRDQEVVDVIALLSSAPLVSLVGPGGVGKTRLSIEAASLASDHFGDGVWFVPLAPVTDRAAVPDAVAEVLGVQETAGRTLTESIVGAIAGRDLLLILDNCEHVVDGARAVAQAVVGACSPVVVLVTGREPLGVTGERVLPVRPLATGTDSEAHVAPAVELFGVRARAADPVFALDGERIETVRRICERLDGMPLAIELAAARVRGLGLGGLDEHLDDRFRLLRRRGGEDARHRTLRATVGWSYDLLDARLQELFCRAGVFAGGFTLDAAERVLAFGDLDQLDVADGVAELVDKSMLQTVDAPSGHRYRMLETMRQFGAESIDASSRERAHRRFVRHYAAWCGEADRALFGADAADTVLRLRDDFDNVREAHRLACRAGRLDEAAGIAVSMHEFGVRDVNGEPFSWCVDLVERVPRSDPRYGELLGAATWACRARGDRELARDLMKVFDELDTSGELAPSARALHHQAVTRWFLHDTGQSIELHRRALERTHADGDTAYEPYVLSTLSMVLDSFDRPRAEETARAALALGRASASPLPSCAGLLALAGTVVHADPRAALDLVEELTVLAHDAELLWYEATGVRLEAHTRSRAGSFAEASRTYIRALDLNGVGDFGELLWYTVLNIVEHLARIGRPAAAATALGALSAAPAAPSDDLVVRSLRRMRARIEADLDGDLAALETAGGGMGLAELLGFLRGELVDHAAGRRR